MPISRILEYFVLGTTTFTLAILIIVQNFTIVHEQQFVYLSHSFLQGNTYFAEEHVSYNALDYSYYDGNHYWPEAPLPAVLLMPFVAVFGDDFLQGYLQVIALLVIAYLIFKITRSYEYSQKDSFYFVFLILFGSVLYGLAVIPWSFYFAQVLSLTFVLLAYYLYKLQKPLWLIGIIVAFAIATRYTMIIAPLFFVLSIYVQGGLNTRTLKKIIVFGLPIFFVGVGILLYNYIRFDSIFVTGYALVSLGGNDFYGFDKNNLFSLTNIPSNLYYYFIKMPEPILEEGKLRLVFPYIKGSLVSLSFFVVAPFFINAFRSLVNRTKEIYTLWLVTILGMLFILSHYSPGTAQYLGPRYMLDVVPWLFILILIVFKGKRLLPRHKVVIIGSGIINFYLILSVIS